MPNDIPNHAITFATNINFIFSNFSSAFITPQMRSNLELFCNIDTSLLSFSSSKLIES